MVRRAGFTCFLQQYLIKFHNHYLSHTNAIMDINKFKFILFVLMSISSQLTHSQAVTLTSEIVWREKELYLLQYDKVNVPFLRLSYKNNGPDSLYFSNKFAGKKYFNFDYYAGFLVNVNVIDQWKYILDSLPNWVDKEYNIIEPKENSEELGSSFFILPKGRKVLSDFEIMASNEHHIMDILTSLLVYQDSLDKDSVNLQLCFFHNPDKKPEIFNDEYINKLRLKFDKEKELIERRITDSLFNIEWMNNKKYRSCIYLKPGESKYIEFDLTPFFLLKGVYNISIKSLLMSEYMKSINVELDRRHNGYRLYEGLINGVKAKVKI